MTLPLGSLFVDLHTSDYDISNGLTMCPYACLFFVLTIITQILFLTSNDACRHRSCQYFGVNVALLANLASKLYHDSMKIVGPILYTEHFKYRFVAIALFFSLIMNLTRSTSKANASIFSNFPLFTKKLDNLDYPIGPLTSSYGLAIKGINITSPRPLIYGNNIPW